MIEKIIAVFYDDYTCIRVGICILSIIVSLIFTIFFFIKKEKIVKYTKINDDEDIWKKYVGTKSFFYQKYDNNPKKNINGSFKRGIEKNLRYLYLAWFGVFLITGLISVISIFKPFPDKFLENKEYLKFKTKYWIVVNTERENSNYEIHKKLTTENDSLDFQLVMRIEGYIISETPLIQFDYPIGDSITVNFIKDLDLNGNLSDRIIDSLKKSHVYEKNDTLKSKKNGFEFEYSINREKGLNKKGEECMINTMVRSQQKDSSFKYQKFFEDSKLTREDSKPLIDAIYQADSIYQAENKDSVLKRIAQANKTPTQMKPLEKRNLFMTITSVLSLSANVILLLLFGFLSTKTDLFSREKNKHSVFPIYKNFVIIIFVIISIILFLDAFHFPPLRFSESFMFVINLIVALTSVIAVFGCWGSLNNSYTSFPFWFKFLMIFYAMAQYLELHIAYSDIFFNKVAELALLGVSFIAKAVIVYILLWWFPNNKRALWFFFTSVNNFRTEDDYEDFLKIVKLAKNHTTTTDSENDKI